MLAWPSDWLNRHGFQAQRLYLKVVIHGELGGSRATTKRLLVLKSGTWRECESSYDNRQSPSAEIYNVKLPGAVFLISCILCGTGQCRAGWLEAPGTRQAGYESAPGGGGFSFPAAGTSAIASSEVVLIALAELMPIAT